jgi:hypothetical protein
MASRIRNRVEPAFGWLFVALVMAALSVVILSATRPIVKVTAELPVQQADSRAK